MRFSFPGAGFTQTLGKLESDDGGSAWFVFQQSHLPEPCAWFEGRDLQHPDLGRRRRRISSGRLFFTRGRGLHWDGHLHSDASRQEQKVFVAKVAEGEDALLGVKMLQRRPPCQQLDGALPQTPKKNCALQCF